MSKPWGWGGFEAYLDTPISKIREEFNIKILSLLLIHLVLFSCGKTTQEPTDQSTTIVKQTETTFQTILDSTQVKGAILIYDPQRKVYHSNSFIKAEETYVPASTFKITNSIIGLEMGILQDESTVFEWDGAPRDFPAWEQDLSLREAFQASCVPCYQGLARKIGADSMNAYVQKLDYGKMDIDTNTIDNFWLRGKSRISPMEQVGFLGRLYEGRLPIKNKTMKTLETIMEMESTEEYTLYAKTGLAIDGSKMVGWFVGYQETNDGVYYFATKLEPTSEEMDRADFLPLRRRVTLAALEHLIQ
ncbi:MAG: class D beta-lactamase [Bacteroidota bacterium]